MSSPVHYSETSSQISGHLSSQFSDSTQKRDRRFNLNRPDLGNLPSSNIQSQNKSLLTNLDSDEISNREFDTKTCIWGTQVNINLCMNEFLTFFKEFKENRNEQQETEENYPKYPQMLDDIASSQIYNLNLDCQNLYQFNPNLYDLLINYPQEVLPLFDSVIDTQYKKEYPEDNDSLFKIQIKTFNLLKTKKMRDIDPDDIDKLIAFRAMVVRVGNIIPDIKIAFFRCCVCSFETQVEIDRGRINHPKFCQNQNCNAKETLTIIHNRCSFTDKQLIRVQETPDAIPEGETPQTVDVFCYGDLIDVAKPGDRVEITGIYKAVSVRVNPIRRNVRAVYRSFIDAIHIKKSSKYRLIIEDSRADSNSEYHTSFKESDALAAQVKVQENKLREMAKDPEIYQKLVNSIAPSIWELEDVKKGLLCQLFGGVTKFIKCDTDNNNNSISKSNHLRAEINILLCGDPGTSKSQLLQYVHKIAPRGIYTSGKGSSAVGLTAYVTKDPESKEAVLESGALVLSDRGICCIDEFDKMSDSARSILHEVMEQQTISIAKSGIICSLNARTSILAAANPKESRYDVNSSVVENIKLPPTLLSRFDLIYLILDKPNEKLDRRLAKHLVSLYYLERDQTTSDFFDISTLTQYISLARRTVHPKITDLAADALIKGYTELRKGGRNYNKKIITATPRQLESLIRISEALARMRFSEFVLEKDVEEAIRLMRVATQSAATDPKTGMINMDLITTGKSASDHQETQKQMDALIALLDDLPNSRNSFSFLLQKFNEQSQKKLTFSQFKEIVSALEQKEVIRCGFWGKGDPIITRID